MHGKPTADHAVILLLVGILLCAHRPADAEQPGPSASAVLPAGVRAVWDLDKAHREATPTRERVSINGLWRWQPAAADAEQPPAGDWGFSKVPGCWPGVTDYMQKDSQTVYLHPAWKDTNFAGVTAAWCEREVTVPDQWAGRRIVVAAEYVNSQATVFIDGKRAGVIGFPAGAVDVTPLCRPGGRHTLSMLVVSLPLAAVMQSYGDTASSKQVAGSVDRRGLCGDVWLASTPPGPRVAEVAVETSVRKEEITVKAAVENLSPGVAYTLRAEVVEGDRVATTFSSRPFRAFDLAAGRTAFSAEWMPERLWDIHTPENQCRLRLTLLDASGKPLDVSLPESFGFREFWIDGRDFYLNGTRIYLSALPLDNAQVSAAAACYDAAKESLLRLKGIGINFVYTHNYGCEPGTHLSFAEILKAADDVGVLVALSQPHFGQYKWDSPDADATNGYARHADFYVRVAGSHPSVVMYSMSHNATGYAEDMNPDMIDGIAAPRDEWSLRNCRRALRAEAIVSRRDPSRIVYHHSSGNLSSMHTTNFYTNFAPVQELSDWFEHWATKGRKPVFTCEYMVPCTWDWTMYRGWYKGRREFGGAAVPWEFCQAEWSAQTLGDKAYQIGEPEKRNLRWEAKQFRDGRLWRRWDYPVQVGNPVFDDQHAVIAAYLTDNWRAFRTWGVSAISPWEHHFFWRLKPGVDKGRQELAVDWDKLQRPGFSPDYLGERYERMDMAYERSDWVATADGQAILRNNMPLLAYIAGKPAAFTSKDHTFLPGETVEKQLIVINNSRATVTCDCEWSFGLPQPVTGRQSVTVETGQQARVPLKLPLPADLTPGKCELKAVFRFAGGETQTDSFLVDVLPRPELARVSAKIALFDPKGETSKLLVTLGVAFQPVEAGADLAGFDVLVIGKQALTVEGPGPDLGRVGEGLAVVVFEQTSEALERRLGFRVTEYGLRHVFRRVPDHPLLAGIGPEHLRDWRGEATLLPPRLSYELSPRYAYTPVVKWCGIETPRVWRCGNRGNVASVLIEKPARGDFLPIVDGGYSLQYSPLIAYREGRGMVLFCQMDVTGRTDDDPAASRLAHNLLSYAADKSQWPSVPRREAVYVGDPAGRRHLEQAGITAAEFDPGKLSADRVLIVGTGGSEKLSAHAATVAGFLKAGGHLLLVGLDQPEAAAILPVQVGMKREEHIAAYFEPPGANTPLAGVGPADVHNRDPKELPLVSEGVTVVGNGVLAATEEGNVVFCQFPPYTITSLQQYNLKRTYRRASFTLSRLLGNLGVGGQTPLLSRFATPVPVAPASTEGRWSQGLYLDQPEEWDDPYRFFRW